MRLPGPDMNRLNLMLRLCKQMKFWGSLIAVALVASACGSASPQSPTGLASPASGSRQSPPGSPAYPPLWVCQPPCPTERLTPGVAFDSDRQVLVLFGGYDKSGQVLSDTWEWSPTSGWTERHPSTVPPGRGMTTMVYDQIRHLTLMDGGRDAVAGSVHCGGFGQAFRPAVRSTWDG